MKLHIQPKGSALCGQYCVAMLCDITPAQSLKAFGTTTGTTTKMVARVLQKFGWQPATKLQAFKSQQELPKLCILKLTYPGQKSWHWVVYNEGLIYCSCLGNYDFKEVGQKVKGGKFTSYLVLNPVKEKTFIRTRSLSHAEQLLLGEAQEPEYKARYSYHDCEEHGIFKVDNELGLAEVTCPRRGKCKVREVFDPAGYAQHYTPAGANKRSPAQDAQLDKILALVEQPGQSDEELRAQMEKIMGCKVKGSAAEMLAALKQGLSGLADAPAEKPAASEPLGFPPAELKRRLERVLKVEIPATPDEIAEGFREGLAFIDYHKQERPEREDEPEEPVEPVEPVEPLLSDIEHYASLQFSVQDVLVILGLPAGTEHTPEFKQQFQRGRLIQTARLRANIFQHATNGSAPAQEMAMKMMEYAAVAEAGE